MCELYNWDWLCCLCLIYMNTNNSASFVCSLLTAGFFLLTHVPTLCLTSNLPLPEKRAGAVRERSEMFSFLFPWINLVSFTTLPSTPTLFRLIFVFKSWSTSSLPSVFLFQNFSFPLKAFIFSFSPLAVSSPPYIYSAYWFRHKQYMQKIRWFSYPFGIWESAVKTGFFFQIKTFHVTLWRFRLMFVSSAILTVWYRIIPRVFYGDWMSPASIKGM